MAGMKESPRQKMIGMMYLVLTCLLALNVSKDILKGFVTVNESLEKTNNSVQQSNEQMLAAFKEAAEKSQSARPYYEKAMGSREFTSNTIAYIEQLKKKLIEVTEKVDSKVADTMRLRFVEKLDDYDVPTFQLIGPDETKPSQSAFTATELKHKLTELHEKLINQLEEMQRSKIAPLPENDYKALKIKIDMIKPVDLNIMENDIKVTWEIQNFYHLPLAAVITNLSKIEADIKNIETEIINQFASASGKLVIKINRFAARVVAPSKYIRSGENYSADIILAGSSSDFTNDNMQILVGARYDSLSKQLISEGTQIPLENGMGKYQIKTVGQGDQNISGVIRFKNAKGEMEYYPFEDKFTVAAPVAAVSADQMNLFYAGVDNSITATAAGVAPKDLVVKINGTNAQLIGLGNGKYSIKPAAPGNCEIVVYSKEQNGQLKSQGPPLKFRIKELPTPFVKINGKIVMGTVEMKRNDLVGISSIGADIPGFEFNAKYKIKSFKILTLKGSEISEDLCHGNALTDQAKLNIGRVRAGGRVFIENIVAVGPDNKERILPNLTIKMKS
jgi:gliding motility-associated protein GldM